MRLADLQARGLQIEARGPDLVVKGVLDDTLVATIQRHKAALLEELAGRVCSRCLHYWRLTDPAVGDCLHHDIVVQRDEDCGAWRPWSGHALEEMR